MKYYTRRAVLLLIAYCSAVVFGRQSATSDLAFAPTCQACTHRSTPQPLIRPDVSIDPIWTTTSPHRRKSCMITALRDTVGPQDNLVSGVSEISFAFSLGVLWSESYIIRTGCGPLGMSDFLERLSYQGVIVFAGISLFNVIVTRQSLEATVLHWVGPLSKWSLWQLRVAEWASVLAVSGAFVALGSQYVHGANMDGLSGIDVAMCRAIRDLP